jgi:hypothetical protein
MSNPVRLIAADQLGSLPQTEFIGDTRFVARSLNVVFGPSGAFKSFYTLDAALFIAQTAPVIYVAAEGAGGLHRRVSAWCQHYQLPPGNLHFVCEEINLLSESHMKALMTVIAPLKPALTVFDTYARCIPGGNENDSKDTGIAVRNTAMFQRQLNCAVIWVHHANRAERGERGSGAMRGGADAMIELTATGDGAVKVICSKLKDGEPWATDELRFFPVAESGILLPSDAGDSARLSAQEMQVLEFLAYDVFETSGAKALQIVNGVSIPERNIYRILSHLKRELHISHDSKGDPYRLTDKGRGVVCKKTAKAASVLSIVK